MTYKEANRGYLGVLNEITSINKPESWSPVAQILIAIYDVMS